MTRRAAILVRISDDRAGQSLGVERQEQDCRALVERQGWLVGKVYRENDTSAYKRRRVTLPDGTTALRVVRPAFREMLMDIADGTVDALVAYDLDRVARDPRDLEDLIDAVEKTKIPTAAVTGEISLSSDNGIFVARLMVNVANKSSRDTSRRVSRAMRSVAERGGVGGGSRPFGYLDDRMTPHDAEAAAVRKLHAQFAEGRSLRGLAGEMAAAFPCRRWDAEAVGRTLRNPRYAGLRVHRGVVIGPARWEPIISVEQHEQTLALMAERTQVARDIGGPRKYLLTGLLVCGQCGARLYPRRNADRQRFGCLPTASGGCGGSLVVYEPAEAAIVDLIRDRLATVDLGQPAPEDPTADLRARIADLEQEQVAWGQRVGDDPSLLVMAQAANRTLAGRISQLRADLKAHQRQRRLHDPADVLASWPTMPADQQRAVVELLIEKVIVGPHPGGPRFAPSRLNVIWR